jgi:hypothetical protein
MPEKNAIEQREKALVGRAFTSTGLSTLLKAAEATAGGWHDAERSEAAGAGEVDILKVPFIYKLVC